MEKPLLINIEEAHFVSVDKEILKNFASQSLKQVKCKIDSIKLLTQNKLEQRKNQYEEQISELFNSTKKEKKI